MSRSPLSLLSISLAIICFGWTVPSLRSQAENSPVGGHLVGTVLGTAPAASAGDHRLEATLRSISDFGFLPNGDMLVADPVLARVFRIGPNGVLQNFAGTGLSVNNGDGGPASEAALREPTRIGADAEGNAYVVTTAEPGIPRTQAVNGRLIRKISATGTISTIAGSGAFGCPTDGSNAAVAPIGVINGFAVSSDGLVYFSVQDCYRIYRLQQDGTIHEFAGTTLENALSLSVGSSIPASRLYFYLLQDMTAAADGSILITMSGSYGSAVRLTPTGVASLVAGQGASYTVSEREGAMSTVRFIGISSAAELPDGRLVVGQNGEIANANTRQELGIIDSNGNYTISFTGDQWDGNPGNVIQRAAVSPVLVRVSPNGDIYLKDRVRGAIFHARQEGIVTPFVGLVWDWMSTITQGDQPQFRGGLDTTLATDRDANTYFVHLNKMYRLSPTGNITHVAGNGLSYPLTDNLPAMESGLFLSSSGHVTTDAAGNIYWADPLRTTIRRLGNDGHIKIIYGAGAVPSAGSLEGLLATSVSATLRHWDVSRDGTLYIWMPLPAGWSSPGTAEQVWKVSADGVMRRHAGSLNPSASTALEGLPALEAGLRAAAKMRVSPEGTVFFLMQYEQRVYRIDADGIIRSVNQGNTHGLSEGTPVTNAAVEVPGSIFLPLNSSRVLLSGYYSQALATMTANGTVNVWRSAYVGQAGNDGGFLRDDRYADTARLAILPDGGLIWDESRTIRRSFPIPAGCTYQANVLELSVGGANDTTSIALTTQPYCPWTVGSSASWVEFDGKTFGTGSTVVPIKTRANPSLEPRTAIVRLAGKDVVIRQAATTRSDILTAAPFVAVVPADGGTVDIQVTASPALSWTAILESPLTASGPVSGLGSGTIRVTMPALPQGTLERRAAVAIGNNRVTITQRGVAAPTIAFTIAATEREAVATIDGVTRKLPHAAEWIIGSSHQVSFPAYTPIEYESLLEFRNAGAGAGVRELTITAPATSSTLTAEFRRLHRLQLGPDPNIDFKEYLITEFPGVQVPAEFSTPNGYWFPEGAVFQALATQTSARTFRHFVSLENPTQNPVSFVVTRPTFLFASFNQQDTTEKAPISVSGDVSWSLPKGTFTTNPAQIAVRSSGAHPEVFIQKHGPVGTPEWISVRRSDAGQTSTFEVSLDQATLREYQGTFPTTLKATVYLYCATCITASFDVDLAWTNPEATSSPRINAITDAGGFRTSVPASMVTFAASPGMILSLFGENLADGVLSASTVPLPTNLAGTQVELLDPNQVSTWIPMPLFYVSAHQINLQIPPDLDIRGSVAPVSFRVRRSDGTLSAQQTLTLTPHSISLFSANQSGSGAPAGLFVRVLPNQEQQRGPLANCGAGGCADTTLNFGPTGSDLYLELYGTGFRAVSGTEQMRAFIGGKEATVVYAGKHPDFVGLDQVNIKVPADTPRGVPVDVYVWTMGSTEGDWIASNRLTLRFD